MSFVSLEFHEGELFMRLNFSVFVLMAFFLMTKLSFASLTNCQFTLNSQILDLEYEKGNNFDLDQSEYYKGTAPDGLKAIVSFLPHQNTWTLKMLNSDKDLELISEASLETDRINLIGKFPQKKYQLTCFRELDS